MDEEEQMKPGLYVINEEGEATQLPPGFYSFDEEGNVGNVPNWQKAIDEFPWKDGGNLIQSWSKRGASSRNINVIGMYVVVALTIGAALTLGIMDRLDGQALAGFLGAAVGYLLSRANAQK